jgi:phospholipase/carboxylesterase
MTPASALIRVMQPPRQPVAGPAPALVLLHGRGADEQDLLGLADWLDPRLAIISLRAPFPLGPGYHWYELVQIGAAEPVSYASARAQLTACITALPAAYDLDPTRLYALGFSQGAVMTGGLLLAPPAAPAPRLAGAVLLSGYLPLDQHMADASPDLADVPIFVGHGRQDSLIPVAFGRHTRDELTALGAAVTYHEYPIAHAINEQELSDIAAWLTAQLDKQAAL